MPPIRERTRRYVMTAAFLASDRAGAMTGTVVNLTGGALVD